MNDELNTPGPLIKKKSRSKNRAPQLERLRAEKARLSFRQFDTGMANSGAGDSVR